MKELLTRKLTRRESNLVLTLIGVIGVLILVLGLRSNPGVLYFAGSEGAIVPVEVENNAVIFGFMMACSGFLGMLGHKEED